MSTTFTQRIRELSRWFIARYDLVIDSSWQSSPSHGLSCNPTFSWFLGIFEALKSCYQWLMSSCKSVKVYDIKTGQYRIRLRSQGKLPTAMSCLTLDIKDRSYLEVHDNITSRCQDCSVSLSRPPPRFMLSYSTRLLTPFGNLP
jgi:hypothetical protein